MKFVCEKNVLCEAVNNVIPAVSSKSTLMALEGIFMSCENNTLKITGYNLELGITKEVSVESEKNGSIILNAVLLSSILNKMPNGNVTISSDEKFLTLIECGDVNFTILGLDPTEYPDMPQVGSEKQFDIPHFLLKNMIAQTLFAVSLSDQNPVLTGSLFDINDGVLNVVSLDGYRLALRKEKVNINENFKFIIPGKTLSEILKLLSRLIADGEDDNITVKVTNKHIVFTVRGYTVLSRLLEGEFMDYKNAIPKEDGTEVLVDVKTFLDSINRAGIIINERAKSPVRCTFENDSISLFCETALGKVNDHIKAEIKGEEVKIGFNNKYMADALKACDSDRIKIKLTGPVSPMKLVPVEDDSFLYLVLPVRLRS